MARAGAIYEFHTSTFKAPSEGDLKVWWVPQSPGKAFEWPVSDLASADMVLDILANYDDFQFGENIKGDYSNAGGLMIFRDGEWEDWGADDFEDFDDWRATNIERPWRRKP